MPSFSVLPGLKVFYFQSNFQTFRAGLSIKKPFSRIFRRNQIERSAHEKNPVVAGAGRLVRPVRRAFRRHHHHRKFLHRSVCKTAGKFSATPICSSGIPRITISPSPGIRHKPNSYFYHPLGTVLAPNDDFSLAFDLQVSDATADGYGFELAVGLLSFSDATNAIFPAASGASPTCLSSIIFRRTDGGRPLLDRRHAERHATRLCRFLFRL